MKDPKVQSLVEQFVKETEALNKTWATLHKHDVFVRVSLEGTHSYEDPKRMAIESVNQNISYVPSSSRRKKE